VLGPCDGLIARNEVKEFRRDHVLPLQPVCHAEIFYLFGNTAIGCPHGGKTLGVFGSTGLDDGGKDSGEEKLTDQ
jgi:hypothetical protein